MNITNQNVEKYAEEMLATMSEYFESTDEFKKNFEQNKVGISSEKINYCLEKFLHAEFDYGTPGIRGLGRASDYWPRLAGYFRSAFSKLSVEKMRELDALITSMIVKCYLYSFLISDKKAEPSNIKTGEQLYEKWIPPIYMFDLGGISDDIMNMLFAIIKKDRDGIKDFFKQNGMTQGFFGGADKTDEILNGYVGAGLVMRIIESAKA